MILALLRGTSDPAVLQAIETSIKAQTKRLKDAVTVNKT
jgi:hypothetical protein